MKIAILHWPGAENDAFTPFNEMLKAEFEACGREAVVLPLDRHLAPRFAAAASGGLDFAVTWQGLGSDLMQGEAATVWDAMKLPLFCLHGDHPCQNPPKHRATSRYVRHFYGTASFVRYANRHFERAHAALLYKVPLLHRAPSPAPGFSGDYFVMPKNLDDTESTAQRWLKRFPATLADLLQECAGAIRDSLLADPATDQHAIVDALLAERRFEEAVAPRMPSAQPHDLFHLVHHEANMYYRNFVAERALVELRDMPLRIFGRGWERHAARGNPRHTFAPGLASAASDPLYRSRWGIVDVAPACDSMHDRTLRAIGCRGSFLLASGWRFADHAVDTDGMMFNAMPGHLRERAERVAADPGGHREACRAFGTEYRRWATHYGLLRDFELIAASLRDAP